MGYKSNIEPDAQIVVGNSAEASRQAAANRDSHAGHGHGDRPHPTEEESVHVSTDNKKSSLNISDINATIADAAKELGIPPEYANKLMGMLGLSNAMQMVEMIGGVMNKLAENGTQAVAGEIPDGSAVAYNGPDARSTQQIQQAAEAGNIRVGQ